MLSGCNELLSKGAGGYFGAQMSRFVGSCQLPLTGVCVRNESSCSLSHSETFAGGLRFDSLFELWLIRSHADSRGDGCVI